MSRIPLLTAISVAACALALGGCSREADVPGDANRAEANVPAIEPVAPQSFALAGGDGTVLGGVTLTEDANGATFKIDAAGMPAGMHGVHLHEKGLCEGPKFTSAGAHWNPGGNQHGRDNPQGSHLGDLANFDVPASGSGSTNLMLAGVTMSGVGALADADGTSLVIHAKPDDYKTDPSGDSGDRIACAVVAAAK